MKHLVVLTDPHNGNSFNAACYAADMANFLKSEITLLHAFSLAIPITEPYYAATGSFETEGDANEKINEIARLIKRKVGTEIVVNTKVIEGNVVSVLNGFCEHLDDVCVIAGAESIKGLEGLLFEQTTLKMVEHARVPMIIVPKNYQFKPPTKIGLACDFRDVLKTVHVRPIKEMVQTFKAKLHVIQVGTAPQTFSKGAAAEQYSTLQELLATLMPIFHFVDGVDIEEVILNLSSTIELDLLVVMPRHHQLLHKIFNHSVSKQLVLNSSIPTMIVHG